MNPFKKALLPVAIAFVAGPALAQDSTQPNDTSAVTTTASDTSLFGDHLDVEGKVRGTVGFRAGDLDKEDANVSRTYLKLTGKILEQVRVVVTGEINRQLRANGEDVSDSFDVSEFLKEAYIELRFIGGEPIAVVVGKHEIAFGQELRKMPVFENSPLYNKLFQERVMGFTVKLNYELMNAIDEIAVSAFSSNQDANNTLGDITNIDSVSARIKGRILKDGSLGYRASYMYLGNEETDGVAENRGTVGLVYATESGWGASIDGLVTDKTTNGDEYQYAIRGDISKEVGPGEVVVEATYVQDDVLQLGIGYNLYLTQNTTIGAEVRYSDYDSNSTSGNEDGFTVGASLEAGFGGVEQQRQKTLFGKTQE